MGEKTQAKACGYILARLAREDDAWHILARLARLDHPARPAFYAMMDSMEKRELLVLKDILGTTGRTSPRPSNDAATMPWPVEDWAT